MNTKKTNRRSPKRRFLKPNKPKKRYRIRNWREYNAALKSRGSLTVWVDEAAISGWHCDHKSGRRGASRTYSDAAIGCALTLQAVYHLPLRGTVGLIASLFGLMQVALPVPDFSTLSRRRCGLKLALPARLAPGPLHLVVDASGFKVYGEGEWKVRQHGWSKRRTWRKLHLGVDEQSGEIVSAHVTTPQVRDDAALAQLLEALPPEVKLAQVSGDGLYDSRECYRLLQERAARAAIPPRHGARRANLEQKAELEARNRNLERIAWWSRWAASEAVGRACWKVEVDYHRRSLAETTFFRLKSVFGERLSARLEQAQDAELLLWCATLNRITHLGMPQSYAV